MGIACSRPTIRSVQADSMLMHAVASRAADRLRDTSRLPLLPPGVECANAGRQNRSVCGNPACAKVSPASEKFQKCMSCKAVYYCSESCQHEHYPVHRVLCKQIRKTCAVEDTVFGLPLPVGTAVEAIGLRAAADLNGQVGTVVGCQDARVQIQFTSGSKALRLCNIVPVDKGTATTLSI